MTSEFVILVSGSRDWDNKQLIKDALQSIEIPPDHHPLLVHGNCQGVDLMADEIAKEMKWNIKACPADWRRYGRMAGPIRNKEMVTQNRPHVIVCFRKNNSAGTSDAIKHGKAYAGQLISRLRLFVVYDDKDNATEKTIIVQKK